MPHGDAGQPRGPVPALPRLQDARDLALPALARARNAATAPDGPRFLARAGRILGDDEAHGPLRPLGQCVHAPVKLAGRARAPEAGA